VTLASVRRWSAWSAGREDADAWRRWCAEPVALAAGGCPEARFLPPLIRRRCSPLGRIALTAAFACCGEEGLDRCSTVFASRHGNINESIDLLDRLAQRQQLSPTVFSHTVHNAQAALFSLAAHNAHTSNSVAAQADTFGCAWLEALALLEREPERPVLIVMADVPLAEAFAHLVDEPVASYGLALLIGAAQAGDGLAFAIEPAAPAPSRAPWPDAMEFLRWMLSEERRLALGTGPRRFVWQKTVEASRSTRSEPPASEVPLAD
jgi:hypothetical protein